MIVSAHQPYFAPYLGFFTKAYLSDILVLLDSVQFPRGTTWTSRNRFKNDQGTLWMTIPVWKKGRGLQKISDVRICRDDRLARKHLESLKVAYSNAPYFEDHSAFAEEMFSPRFEKLIDLNLEVIRYLLNQLQIRAKVVLLSELGIEARGELLPVELCREMGAFRFLVQDCAAKYLNVHLFEDAGIQIDYFKYPSPVYPQLWGQFIPDLSTFDLIFNCGPKARNLLMKCGRDHSASLAAGKKI